MNKCYYDKQMWPQLVTSLLNHTIYCSIMLIDFRIEPYLEFVSESYTSFLFLTHCLSKQKEKWTLCTPYY